MTESIGYEIETKPVTRSEAFAVLSAIRDRTPNGLIGDMTDEQLCQFVDIANMAFQLNLPNSQPVVPADFKAKRQHPDESSSGRVPMPSPLPAGFKVPKGKRI